MDSFEELGIAPELVEALAAEGIEKPTPLQESSIPLLSKGNNLVLMAGPGAGLLVAWAVPILERVPADEAGTRILVTAADREGALRLAESIGRLARDTGHTTAALGTSWAFPERAHVLVATPPDLIDAVRGGTVSLDQVEAWIVDQAQNLERLGGLDPLEEVFQFLPAAAQRVLSALPLTPGVADFVERHLKRTMTVPRAHDPASTSGRGTVRYRVVREPSEDELAPVVAQLFEDGARHVLVFCRSEDRAADIGDRLTLRGFVAGAPGEADAPVWLGVDALEARTALEGAEGVVVVSADVPADEDTFDRRHGISLEGVILALGREVEHLKDVARRTGYGLVPFPGHARRAASVLAELQETLEEALETEDIGAYLVALDPILGKHDPAEVAAAAVALLRRKTPRTETPRPRAEATKAPSAAPSWAKLFVSVGSRDGLVPGDLLGAVTGEAGIPGETVGKIDIRESHTLLEVHDGVAQKVIKALNGITIRGRAVRVDFDRPRRGSPSPGRRGPARRGRDD